LDEYQPSAVNPKTAVVESGRQGSGADSEQLQHEESGPSTPTGEEKTGDGPAWRALMRELIETVVLTLIIFLLIRTFVQNFRVEGMSMEPSFHDGQFLLINKFAYRIGEPERGDVVVFHYPRDPSRDFIKRVIGLPGEVVEIQEGQIYVDGEVLPELTDVQPATYNTRATMLDANEVYVLGDNRPNSSDSHSWGPLPMDLIVGEVVLSYWPPDTWGLISIPVTADQP
jgi:signal peptidase I